MTKKYHPSKKYTSRRKSKKSHREKQCSSKSSSSTEISYIKTENHSVDDIHQELESHSQCFKKKYRRKYDRNRSQKIIRHNCDDPSVSHSVSHSNHFSISYSICYPRRDHTRNNRTVKVKRPKINREKINKSFSKMRKRF